MFLGELIGRPIDSCKAEGFILAIETIADGHKDVQVQERE
jgi:hypothetical protein